MQRPAADTDTLERGIMLMTAGTGEGDIQIGGYLLWNGWHIHLFSSPSPDFSKARHFAFVSKQIVAHFFVGVKRKISKARRKRVLKNRIFF
nr:hypothetical protein [uncultured Oscillibacter sp.]